MACRTPADPQLIYGEIDASLSSAAIDRLKRANLNSHEENSEPDTGTCSEESQIGSEGEETTSTEQRTFLVIVNDDGSFTLDSSGVIVKNADPDTVIPVTLPVNKMKSVEQPLPGARTLPTTGRSRKAKLQTRTGLNSESESSYEFVHPSGSSENSGIPVIDLEDTVSPLDIHLPNVRGVLVSGTISLEAVTLSPSPSESPAPTPASVIVSNPANSTPSIDLTDFTKQLDPQSLANLENVLQSEQAREILETLTFDEEVSEVTHTLKSESAQPLWDHSYSQSVSSTRTVIAGPSPAIVSTSVIVPIQSVIQTVPSNNSSPSVVTVRRPSISKPSVAVISQPPAMSPVITVNNTPKGRPSSGSSSSGGSRRVSEADRESNANIRRSQRQQDRIERQEAERIMAENQQMLQREKEIMKEAKIVAAVSSPVQPVQIVQTVQHNVTVVPESPIVVAAPVSAAPSPLPVTPVVAVVEDNSTPKSESGRPKRQNRKLPAHLADPNYVHFDEDVKVVKEIRLVENEEEVEVKEEPDDELTIVEDDEEVTEDDPNRLWCICRQPHNNRFMICCDKCEEWFHGKCVGVTKAQGKAMELKQMLWHCPNCKKELKTPVKINQKQSVIVNRSSDNTPTNSDKPSGGRKVGRPPKNKAAVAVVSTPVSSKVQETVTEISPKQNKKKIDVPAPVTRHESVTEKANNCMVCGRSARKDSAYCSDKCVQKWAESVGSKVSVVPAPTKPAAPIPNANASTPTPPTPTTTTPVASSSPNQKLKRANSVKQLEPEKATPFLTFHVISSGSTKSTETVPPRPKELTASALVKQSQLQQQQSATTPQKTPTTPISPTVPNSIPTVPGISPNSVTAIINSKPSVTVNKMVESENKLKTSFKGAPLKIDTALAQSQQTQIQSPTTPVGSKRSRTSSESSSNKAQKFTIKKDKDFQRAKEKEKEPERDGPTSEKLLRENMRKTIREVLKNRLKDVDDDEKKILESSGNTPEIMAEKIEDELCRCYGGAMNPKCKAKYRSIYFNFKDTKNSLFREILAGNIKPKVLVRMEPQQMASAELTEWRLKENRKELEAIKRAELDKLAEAKKQQLIDSGVDDAVVVAEETRPKDIADVIDADKDKHSGGEKEKKEKKDGSHSHSSHRRDKDRRSKDKDRDDKRRDSKDHGSSSSSKDKDRRDREKDKESRRRSSRHRHRSGEKSKERDREKDRKHKEKDGKDVSRSSKSDANSESSRRDSESSKRMDKKDELNKTANEENKQDETPKASYSGDDSTPPQQQTTPTENSKSDARHSTDSEQEQPSSTIKTPDFVEDGSAHSAQFVLLNGGGCKPIFNSQLTMQELGNLAVSVYDVSHVGLEGTLFPEAPVPFVGRISPETVWDYINKMKKTKEVIIFRLAPATQADTAIYSSFYDYLSARGRLGVLGSITHPLKDVYLCPLDKHTPINRSLLPFRGGPGIPKERTNCLLAIVTRHIVDVNHQALKRKGSISGDVNKKKQKVETGKTGTQKTAGGNNSKVTTRKLSMDVKVENSKSPDADLELTDSKDKIESSKASKDDDDEPYTPWEDDDVDAEVKPVIPAAKPDTQKLLEELNAKIERERQEIENIAGAISNRKNITGIPGLDGDFPDSPSPNIITKPLTEQVPFFLRSNKDIGSNSAKSRDTQPVNIPGLDMEVGSVFTPQKPQEVVDIRDDDDDYDDDPVEIFTPSQTYAADPRKREPVPKMVTSTPIPIVPQPIEIIPGLSNDITDNADSEAYSPSAVQFSDDEDKKDLDEENDSRETIVDDTDDEPLPPGVELDKESSPAILTSPTKPTFKLEDPRLAVSAPAEEIDKPSSAPLMELEDDSEPPPPGESTAPSTPIKINLPNVFESPSTDDLPFPSMALLSKASQKVKININLSTKILPAPKENEDLAANKIETPGPKNIQRQLPSLQQMQTSSTTPTSQLPVQTQPPSPAMPKLHQPPPCIPALQKAPMAPSLSLPIQIPPPSLQNIPAIPLQIPPPSLQAGPPPPRISLGINVNVPPPPLTGLGIIPQIPGMMPRGMPPLTPGGIRFPPPVSIPPPPIISKNESNVNTAATVVGGVRRPFIPPVPNPLAKAGLRPNTPRMTGVVPDVSVIDNSNKIQPRTPTPENNLDHNIIRGRDRESRFDRNIREGDREPRFDRNNRESDILDVDRRQRVYQPGDRGRNFHRKPFDNRIRRRSRSDDRSTRSRSRERRRRRGGRSRSRSPPWRRNRRSRSRSPRTSNRRRSRSHSPSSHEIKSPGMRRSSNHLRSSRSKDKSRSRSRSPKRSYSRRSRSRSKSNSRSRSPSVSSKVKSFSAEKVKSPSQDGKSPIIGSREEDWEDDPEDGGGPTIENLHPDTTEKEPAFEFSADKIGAVAIHLSPEIVQME